MADLSGNLQVAQSSTGPLQPGPNGVLNADAPPSPPKVNAAAQRPGTPLSFVVTGPARSGTSAVARLINMHPAAFCGHELFGAPSRLEVVRYPATIGQSLARRHSLSRDAPVFEHQIALMARRPGPTMVGDKNPDYIFGLARISQIDPPLATLLCLRDPQGLAKSWNTREAPWHPARWATGRVGFFAIFELTLSLAAAARFLPDTTLIVPHAALLRDSTQVRRDLQRFLRLEDTPPDPFAAAFHSAMSTSEQAIEKVGMTAQDEQAMECVSLTPFLPYLTAGQTFRLSEFTGLIQQHLGQCGLTLTQDVTALARANGRDEVRQYAELWLERATSVWADILTPPHPLPGLAASHAPDPTNSGPNSPASFATKD